MKIEKIKEIVRNLLWSITFPETPVDTKDDLNLLLTTEIEDFSDGYHTFKELYEFRKMYNAALFNEWAKIEEPYLSDEKQGFDFKPKYDVHKSWKHNDGELCFGGGWFIVIANLPEGQISNHYEAKDWDLFKIPETERVKYEFDGHTPQDVLERLLKL